MGLLTSCLSQLPMPQALDEEVSHSILMDWGTAATSKVQSTLPEGQFEYWLCGRGLHIA